MWIFVIATIVALDVCCSTGGCAAIGQAIKILQRLLHRCRGTVAAAVAVAEVVAPLPLPLPKGEASGSGSGEDRREQFPPGVPVVPQCEHPARAKTWRGTNQFYVQQSCNECGRVLFRTSREQL